MRSCGDPDPVETPKTWPLIWPSIFPEPACYLLDKTTLVAVSHAAWIAYLEDGILRIAHSQRQDCEVSTILLGRDMMAWMAKGTARVFETLLRWEGHAVHEHTWKWATYDEAVEGHCALVAEIEAIQAGQLPEWDPGDDAWARDD